MNWDAIGAVGQVLGSVAVFVTLGYLAVQIRHARIAQNAASCERVAQRFNQINALMATDESLTQIILRGNHDPDSLSPTERYRYFVTQQSYANQHAQLFSLYKLGALPRQDWELHLDALVASSLPRHRDFVNAQPEFWRAIDAYGPSKRATRNYSVAAVVPD